MRYFFSTLFVLLTVALSSQRLVGADAVFTNTAVVIRFTLGAGTFCSSYSIMHSTDSLALQNIYNGGQCSADNSPTQFIYPHTGFVPDVVNYYRVTLDAWENSPLLKIFPSKTGRSGLFLFPNPMGPSDDILNLRALGTENTKLFGFLYSRFGTVVRELNFVTSGTQAQLNMSDLDRGVYVLWLTDGNNVYSGKFIVTN